MATSAAGGTSTPTPAPAGGAAPAPGAGAPPAAGAALAAANAADADKYTRTTKKTLTVEVVNLTPASMDVTVKTSFLARDEAGKHEVLTEKTVENPVTVQPARSASFTTEEVSFTHTIAHRAPAPPKAGAGTGKMAATAPAPMIPTSGHAYFGYKVEVFQGPDLVGTTASETH
jgi:hypothetical protein